MAPLLKLYSDSKMYLKPVRCLWSHINAEPFNLLLLKYQKQHPQESSTGNYSNISVSPAPVCSLVSFEVYLLRRVGAFSFSVLVPSVKLLRVLSQSVIVVASSTGPGLEWVSPLAVT